MRYPDKFEPAEEGGFVVTFRDIPEAITQGDNENEALTMAQDALITAWNFKNGARSLGADRGRTLR